MKHIIELLSLRAFKDWFVLGTCFLAVHLCLTLVLLVLTFPVGVPLTLALWPWGGACWLAAAGITALGIAVESMPAGIVVGAHDK